MKAFPNLKKTLKNITRSLTEKNNYNTADENFLPFSKNVMENKQTFKELLGDSQDILIRTFNVRLANDEKVKVLLLAIDGITSIETIRKDILEALIERPPQFKANDQLQAFREQITTKRIAFIDNLHEAVYRVLKGNVLLIIDQYDEALIIDAEKFQERTLDEPSNEQAVRGARDSFVELTNVNLSLIRERIIHPSLRFDAIEIGEYSHTTITLAYVKDIVCPQLLKRLKERLAEIELDAVESSGQIEQLIEDHPYSIFPTIGNTERPDKATAFLMEGKIIIFVEGNPVSLVVPYLFVETIQSIEDYHSRPYYSSFIRLLRFIAFIISISLPALYVSALNFHKEIIPSDMIVPIIQARELVPFPLVMEIVMMILMFEVVREAGVRLPQQIGSALSIVGALILGEVSVSAGLVGAPTIVVVSLSYIAAFVITSIADVTALLRLFLFTASSFFGFFGLIVGLMGVFSHMISLTSIGVPYMAPFAPTYFRDWLDSFVRFPTRLLKYRPKSIPNQRDVKIRSVPKMVGKNEKNLPF